MNDYENRIKHQVAAASNDDAMLRMETVLALTGLSRSGIYNKIAAGEFPKQIKCGPKSARWRSGDVLGWARQQAAA